ncbi:hypothetical protein [uncultured Paenibacillus sp.]|uniref:hypothetical protein n=1 Tax=uncultured Paenibacillus sp. TaxID=227322 RepID=UPI0028D833EF|nr:hypothetical protein [uncultured Paenibacillus sp.]
MERLEADFTCEADDSRGIALPEFQRRPFRPKAGQVPARMPAPLLVRFCRRHCETVFGREVQNLHLDSCK